MQDYKEFAQSELNKLIPFQDKFKEEYNLESYEKWFYDSESSLLRLYNNDEEEIFFRYIPIGTYSKNSETWMWAWFNESSEEPNKDETLKIKQFGVENNYPKLFNESFPSDEFDGWEFLSISLFLLDGIGVYKVTSDHLEKYMILTNVYENYDSTEIQRIKQSIVECRTHGFGRPALVCQHLNLKTKKGFEEAFETFPKMDLEEGDDFQAWCSECEQIRLSTKGWNEESENFAKIKLVCEDCYFELKEFNQ